MIATFDRIQAVLMYGGLGIGLAYCLGMILATWPRRTARRRLKELTWGRRP